MNQLLLLWHYDCEVIRNYGCIYGNIKWPSQVLLAVIIPSPGSLAAGTPEYLVFQTVICASGRSRMMLFHWSRTHFINLMREEKSLRRRAPHPNRTFCISFLLVQEMRIDVDYYLGGMKSFQIADPDLWSRSELQKAWFLHAIPSLSILLVLLVKLIRILPKLCYVDWKTCKLCEIQQIWWFNSVWNTTIRKH